MLVAGVDGCKVGWLRVVEDLASGDLLFDVSESAAELFDRRPRPAVLGIDIPIGLPEHGPRACDTAARRLLGRPRSSSVFPVPVRAALAARNRLEADRIHRGVDGRGVGAQAWNLYPKIREVDAALRGRPELTQRVREVHPEVAFRAWNGGRALRHNKKTHEGHAERRRLVDAEFGAEAYGDVRAAFKAGDVAHDDILDAFAVLWTARRIHRGLAVTLPEEPPIDASGLRMEIVY